MKLSTSLLTGFASCAFLASAPATIVINEVHARTPLSSDTVEADANFEYVELRSTTNGVEAATDLWLLIIDNDGASVGVVDQAWKLVDGNGDPLSTGTNGLLLLGDGATGASYPYLNVKAPATTLGDPPGMGSDNIENSAITVLLVQGYTNPAPLGADTKPDVDRDDDGILDWADGTPPAVRYTSLLWTSLIDSVGYNGDAGATIKPAYLSVGANLSASAVVKGVVSRNAPVVQFIPHNMSRLASDTAANQRNAWYGAVTSGSTGGSVAFGTNYFNIPTAQTWRGLATPGRPNLSAAPSAAAFRINEIHANPSGTPGRSAPTIVSASPVADDGNFEYIEIINTAPNQSGGSDFSASLEGFALLMVDNKGGTIGEVIEAWDLSKFSTGSNGLLLIGDGFTNRDCPWLKNIDPQTQVGDPATDVPTKYSALGRGDMENDGVTYMLVSGFSNNVKVDLDSNDDGIFNISPWTTEADSVALPEIGVNDVLLSDKQSGYSAAPRAFVSDNYSITAVAATNVITTSAPHFLAVGNAVHITSVTPAAPGITASLYTSFFVTAVPSATTLRISATAGGADVDITSNITAGNLRTRVKSADNISRLNGNATAKSLAALAYGQLGSRSAYALAYRNGNFIPATFRGAASPGRANFSASVLPTAGTLRLNEVHINPPLDPDNSEFVEIISSAPHALMTNHWLIVLDASNGSSSGIVKKVIDLRAQSTGSNRLAIFGDGVEEDTNILVPFLSGKTVRDDPALIFGDSQESPNSDNNFTPDSLGPNSGVSVLLVTYAATGNAVPVAPGSDLDANNDGVLDAVPLWTLVDGISTGNGIGGVPILTQGVGSPGNVSRVVGNLTANSGAAWIGGEVAGASAISFEYGANYFGSFKGAASPGRANVTATPNLATTLLLNEVNINPPGGDNNKEFIELRSPTNGVVGGAGYSVLLIDNSGADTGRVLQVYDLDSAATGTNGLLLAGPNYNTLLPWIGLSAPSVGTSIFAPDDMTDNDIGLDTDNGALTVVLAKYFTGRVGDDLDMGTNADLSQVDDHVLNTPFAWASMADSIAMKGFTASTILPVTYSLEGFIFPGTPDLSVPIPASPNQANGYTPDTVARFSNQLTANTASAWYGANILGTAGTSTAYDSVAFFPANLFGGKVTPGQPNVDLLTDLSDPDGDGVPMIIEDALGMNNFAPDVQKLPTPGWAVIPGQNGGNPQPTFTVIRPNGGVAGITFAVEASTDLIDWFALTGGTSVKSTTIDSPVTGMETKVYGLPTSFLGFMSEGHVFFRLRATR